MKISITAILILVSSVAFSQTKYILLEKGWSTAATFTDSITKKQIRTGSFPVYSNQLDSLLGFVKKFKQLGKQGLKRTYFDNDDYKTSTIAFDILNVQHPYGDVYDINITSTTEDGVFKMKLADPSQTMYHTKSYINGFISYLEKTIKDREKTKN